MNFKKIAILSVMLISILFTCCTKNEENQLDVGVYDLTKEMKLDEVHRLNFSTYERIGKDNSIALEYIEELSLQGVDVNSLDLNQISRTTLENNDIIIFSVRVKDSNTTFVAYNHLGEYMILEQDIDEEHCSLKTLNNEIFASYSVDQGLKTYENTMVEDFNTSVGEKNLLIYGENSDLKSTCCRKQSSYTECVNCTYQGNVAIFVIMTMVYPPSLPAGLLSCVGASSSAWC